MRASAARPANPEFGSETIFCRLNAKFREFLSLLKKSLSGRSADQKRIQHRQTKTKTLRKKSL
jgi:hypothetical protein